MVRSPFLPYFFFIPQGPYYLHKSLSFLYIRLRVCMWLPKMHSSPHTPAYSSGLKSHLQAIGCQHLGECAELAAHRASWAREHLAGITVFYLAPRTATGAVAVTTLSRGDDSCLASLNGLMEHGIWEGVKYLYHKLNCFAV